MVEPVGEGQAEWRHAARVRLDRKGPQGVALAALADGLDDGAEDFD